nr:15112_t:CDS:2 [Entrophospora candida]
MSTNNNLIRNYFLETNDSEWNLYDYVKFRYKYNSSKFTDKKQEHCFFYNKLKEKCSDVRNWENNDKVEGWWAGIEYRSTNFSNGFWDGLMMKAETTTNISTLNCYIDDLENYLSNLNGRKQILSVDIDFNRLKWHSANKEKCYSDLLDTLRNHPWNHPLGNSIVEAKHKHKDKNFIDVEDWAIFFPLHSISKYMIPVEHYEGEVTVLGSAKRKKDGYSKNDPNSTRSNKGRRSDVLVSSGDDLLNYYDIFVCEVVGVPEYIDNVKYKKDKIKGKRLSVDMLNFIINIFIDEYYNVLTFDDVEFLMMNLQKEWRLYVVDHPYSGVYRCRRVKKLESPTIPIFNRTSSGDNDVKLLDLFKLLSAKFLKSSLRIIQPTPPDTPV